MNAKGVGNDIRSILQLLAETNTLRTARLQFLLTSRQKHLLYLASAQCQELFTTADSSSTLSVKWEKNLALEKVCINSITRGENLVEDMPMLGVLVSNN
jgi:hypothetical protein